jgi:hypothetical protein
VFFEDANRDWRGQLADVEITWTGPYSMQGRLPSAERYDEPLIVLSN